MLAGAQERVYQGGTVLDKMLAVIQDQQYVPGSQVLQQCFGKRESGLLAYAEGCCDGVGHQPPFGKVSKLYHPHPSTESVEGLASNLDCQACPAASAGTGEGQQLSPREGALDLGYLAFPPDKAAQGHGEIVHGVFVAVLRRTFTGGHRLLERVLGGIFGGHGPSFGPGGGEGRRVQFRAHGSEVEFVAGGGQVEVGEGHAHPFAEGFGGPPELRRPEGPSTHGAQLPERPDVVEPAHPVSQLSRDAGAFLEQRRSPGRVVLGERDHAQVEEGHGGVAEVAQLAAQDQRRFELGQRRIEVAIQYCRGGQDLAQVGTGVVVEVLLHQRVGLCNKRRHALYEAPVQ
jgi:hypothetical protein